MTKKKSWIDKLNEPIEPKIKITEKAFAGIPAGSKMFIASPQLIEKYIHQIEIGRQVDSKTIRKDLALEHNADFTCPLTTGIFLRIIAEANYEKWQQGNSLENIAPFWRAITPSSSLAEKLSFGQDFIVKQLEKERKL